MGRAAVWSNARDPANKLLHDAIHDAGHEACVVATGPDDTASIAVEIGETGIVQLEIDGTEIGTLDTIYYRKPVPPSFGLEASQSRFLAREVMQGLESAFSLTGATWVNHPNSNRLAADKLGNLARAQRAGLLVPRTWAGDAVQRRASGRLVGKPVTHGLMQREDGAAMVFATRLPDDFDPVHDTEQGVPMLVQEEIEADADIRATVVGDEVLVAERQRVGDELDWRASERPEGWEAVDLPVDIQRKLRGLVMGRGLHYGACDILRQGDRYVFLELNPNGQWGWLEIEAGLPISAALASLVGVEA